MIYVVYSKSQQGYLVTLEVIGTEAPVASVTDARVLDVLAQVLKSARETGGLTIELESYYQGGSNAGTDYGPDAKMVCDVALQAQGEKGGVYGWDERHEPVKERKGEGISGGVSGTMEGRNYWGEGQKVTTPATYTRKSNGNERKGV